MKIKKKHISICENCNGDGYIMEDNSDFGVESKVPRWCHICNGHGYKLTHNKKEKLKALALSIFEEGENGEAWEEQRRING